MTRYLVAPLGGVAATYTGDQYTDHGAGLAATRSGSTEPASHDLVAIEGADRRLRVAGRKLAITCVDDRCESDLRGLLNVEVTS